MSKKKSKTKKSDDPRSLAVGYNRKKAVSDHSLFRSFQRNLLSLISHELRTPLTGVVNALTLIKEGRSEAIDDAIRNSKRLEQNLSSLLDLASIEGQTFQLQLREVDLQRILKSKLRLFQDVFSRATITLAEKHGTVMPALADPERMGTVFEQLLQIIERYSEQDSLKIRISSSAILFEFPLQKGKQEAFEKEWRMGLTSSQSGLGSPLSIFSEVLQDESAFLSRQEEGLGSELFLIHEILRRHDGNLEKTHAESTVKVEVKLPEISNEKSLRALVAARVYQTATGVGSVTLGFIKVAQFSTDLEVSLRKCLFRGSDSLYFIHEWDVFVLILSDLRSDDLNLVKERVKSSLQEFEVESVRFSICPYDTTNPDELIRFGLEG